MTDAIVHHVRAAWPLGGQHTRRTIIIGDPVAGEDLAEVAQSDAKAIAFVLHESLPGATFDRLLAELLLMKASHLVVSHGAKSHDPRRDPHESY